MSSEKVKSENIEPEVNGTQSNALLMNQISNSEVRHRVLNDYILMEIFDFTEIKDLFRWIRVSQQFWECIRSVLKVRKHLIVFESELILEMRRKFKIHLCFERQHSKNGSNYWKNNIESAINHKNSIYYLNVDNNFTSIAEKCPLIECLALKNCYLDETLFECLDSNLKQLKCISIFECILDIKAIDSINELKTLFENITHLSLNQIKRLNDKSFDSNSEEIREMLWSFIKLFKNVKKLKIVAEIVIGIKRLFLEKIRSLDSLDVNLGLPGQECLGISPVFKTDNISHLKRLDIKDYYINPENFQRIVNEMNLKSLHFSCVPFDINLLSNLAEKHKQLKELSIYWTYFMPYSYVENLFKFENVRHFVLHNSPMNLNHFRQIIGLFPSLAILHFTPYYGIKCGLKQSSNYSCKTCLGICFDSIPRMDSLKRFVVSFNDMCPALVHCLKGFLQLNHLTIHCYWNKNSNEETKMRYDLYFRDIVEYLSDKCRQTPTKAFKLFVCKFVAIPKQTVIPMNLQIVGKSHIYISVEV